MPDDGKSLAIIHADMDAFFASVEVHDDPRLKGRPVIVGGRPDGRGVVCSATYEARLRGVHSAMPLAHAARICPDAVFLPVRMDRYVEMSRLIMTIFESFTPQVEQISVDEAFLDVRGCEKLFGNAEEIGRAIKKKVRAETGLIVSIGIAPVKSLAKLASDLDKPDGFCVIRADEIHKILDPLPVRKLWGVGTVTEKKLASAGITTIGRLRQTPPDVLEAFLGSYTETALDLANGIDAREVEPETDRKSIGAEETFPEDVVDTDTLHEVLRLQSEEIGVRLRRYGLKARTVGLKLRFSDFTTITRSRTLMEAVNATQLIALEAENLLHGKIDLAGKSVRLIGTYASALVPATTITPTLFPDPEVRRMDVIDELRDRLNERYGENTVRWGAAGRPPDPDDET